MRSIQSQPLTGLLIGIGIMAGLASLFSVWAAIEYQSGNGKDSFAFAFGQALKLFLWLTPFGGVGGLLTGVVQAYIHTHNGPVIAVLHSVLIGGLILLGLSFLAALGLGVQYSQDWGRVPTPMAVVAIWAIISLPSLVVGLIGGGIYGYVATGKQ